MDEEPLGARGEVAAQGCRVLVQVGGGLGGGVGVAEVDEGLGEEEVGGEEGGQVGGLLEVEAADELGEEGRVVGGEDEEAGGLLDKE